MKEIFEDIHNSWWTLVIFDYMMFRQEASVETIKMKEIVISNLYVTSVVLYSYEVSSSFST